MAILCAATWVGGVFTRASYFLGRVLGPLVSSVFLAFYLGRPGTVAEKSFIRAIEYYNRKKTLRRMRDSGHQILGALPWLVPWAPCYLPSASAGSVQAFCAQSAIREPHWQQVRDSYYQQFPNAAQRASE